MIGSHGKMLKTITIWLALFLAGTLLGSHITDSRWQNKWDNTVKEAAEKQLNLVNDAVKVYNDKIVQLENLNNETKTELDNLSVVNNDLDDINERLQEQFADSLRERSTCDQTPTVAAVIDTKTVKRQLQADMFRVISDRAKEYARIADENRIRGLSCEAEYRLLRKSVEAHF